MRPITSDDLYAIKWVRDPQISPDGMKVLFEVKEVIPEGELKGYKSSIWIFEDGRIRQFTSGKKNDTSARWSPCGKKISFISDREDKNQIYVLSLDGGEAQKLTSMKNGVGEYAWSPDGRKIAFSALVDNEMETEKNHDEEKIEEKTKEEEPDGEPTTDVRVINKIRYKSNGRGFLPEGNYQIFVIDILSKEVTQITPVSYTHLDVYKRQVQRKGYYTFFGKIHYHFVVCRCGWMQECNQHLSGVHHVDLMFA